MKIVEFDKNSMSKESATLQCVDVANSTAFPTDYNDVYAHLFETDDLLKLFVIDDYNTIRGFAVFDSIKTIYNILYLSGMVLGKDIQGNGISKVLIRRALELLKGEIITLRTHNPRMYNSLIESVVNYAHFPSIKKVPYAIYELASTISYFNKIEENLIIRNCYEEELIQQKTNLKELDDIFGFLNPNDAYGCISLVTENEKLKKLLKK